MGGGTKITIAMDHTLIDYTDDIVVKVGGKPIHFKLPSLAMGGCCSFISTSHALSSSGALCDNVTVLPRSNASGYGLIECVTRPRPPVSTYYPGMNDSFDFDNESITL